MAESEEELKSLLMKVKDRSEKVGLNIQKTKIMASSPITSWQIDGEIMETMTGFILGDSRITADGDCSHEIKRHLLAPWKKSYDQPAAAKLLQSCLTLCDPIDGNPPGSPVPGILQVRTWSGLPFPSPMHESEK